MSGRFRAWYDYERDCNAKTIAMIESVPPDRRGDPNYTRALRKFAHMVAARWMWAFRLGVLPDHPPSREWFPDLGTLDSIRPHLDRVETAWAAYFARLDEETLGRSFEWTGLDGKRWRWLTEELLVQVFGHAWYHRGQIATLVADLGGRAIDTDYIFWNRPEQVG